MNSTDSELNKLIRPQWDWKAYTLISIGFLILFIIAIHLKLDIIDVVKGKLAEAKETIAEIESLKGEEDRELAEWSRNIGAVEEKILAVDKTIFGKR